MSKTINDVIEKYCKKKLPPSEIFRLMKEVVSRRGVYKAVKRFKDTGNCAPRIRSDPERTVRTKKLIKRSERSGGEILQEVPDNLLKTTL